jgi:hypothetical protein
MSRARHSSIHGLVVHRLAVHVMGHDPITRHFFNGFIRLHILYHAAKDPIYGAEIAEELIRHGYRVSQGTLYPGTAGGRG